MQFKDVIGQDAVKEQLIGLYRQNRLSHALLFLGKEGSGALSLAMAFTQFINCEKVNGKSASLAAPGLFGEPAPEENTSLTDSCGTCPSCIKSSGLINPDIHYSYPVVTKKPGEKPVSTDYITQWREFIIDNPYGTIYNWLQYIGAENKQGNITSAECLQIIKTLSLKSFGSEYKFLIMWMPEMLGHEGNKLLKIIEEPPPNTVFIFVAESEQQILPTILSRTQLVKIPKLPPGEIEKALSEKENIEISAARQIAFMSEGNYAEALYLSKTSEDNWEPVLRDWLNTIVRTGPSEQIKWIDEVSKLGREKQKQFLQYFNHLVEQAIRLRTLGLSADASVLKNNERQENINDFAGRLNKLCSISQLEAIVKELDQHTYYIERNANAKILFHALTIRLYHIISDKSVILVS